VLEVGRGVKGLPGGRKRLTVAEEDGGNGGGGETADDGIEKSRGVRQCIRSVISTQNMAYDPGPLASSFTSFEFRDEEREDARLVWVGVVEVVEHVVDVPEVGIDGDDAEALGGCMGVGSVMGGSICCFG